MKTSGLLGAGYVSVNCDVLDPPGARVGKGFWIDGRENGAYTLEGFGQQWQGLSMCVVALSMGALKDLPRLAVKVPFFC